jgi:hypothetical protein
MRWKARTNSEAGEVLRLLARQGEPLLKNLDSGKAIGLLQASASNDETPQETAAAPAANDHDSDSEASCEPAAVAG